MSTIRRATVTALVVLLLAPASPAAQAAGGFAGAGRYAEAMWLVLGKKTGTFYVADVFQGAYAYGDSFHGAGGDPQSMAFVAKGKCKVRKRSVACWASGPARPVGPDEFRMDPLLGSARLTLQMGKHLQRVTWTGQGNAPQPEAGWWGSPLDYSVAWAGTYRDAAVKGTLFGDRLTARQSKKKASFGYLAQGAAAGSVLLETGPYETATVAYRFPLPPGR